MMDNNAGDPARIHENLTANATFAPNQANDAGGADIKKKKPNKKLLIPLIIAGAVIIVAVIVCLIFLLPANMGAKDVLERSSIRIFTDMDGKAYIPQGGSKLTEIKGEAIGGLVTPDRQHAVILEKDGLLFMAGTGTDKESIDSDVYSIIDVCDTGVIYMKQIVSDTALEYSIDEILEATLEDGNFSDTLDSARTTFISSGYANTAQGAKQFYSYWVGEDFDNRHPASKSSTVKEFTRFTFEDGSKVTLDGSNVNKYAFAEDTLAVIYEKEDAIYSLPDGAPEPVKLFTAKSDSSELGVIGISDDSSMAFWYEVDSQNSETNIYCGEAGDYEKIATADNTEGANSTVIFSPDSEKALCLSYDQDFVLLKNAGMECIKVNLGDVLYSRNAYSANDFLRYSSDWSRIYVSVGEGDDASLYCIDEEGEREKVISGISSFQIKDGVIYYLNEDEDLHRAKLSDTELTDDVKIASDVNSFSAESSGVFYMRDYSDSQGSLFYCSNKSEDGEKIASDVYSYAACSDGKSVLFMQEAAEIEDFYVRRGDLLRFTAGKGENEKLLSDAVWVSQVSGYKRDIDADDFWIMKYDYCKDEDVLCALYYIGGKEPEKIASDIRLYNSNQSSADAFNDEGEYEDDYAVAPAAEAPAEEEPAEFF